jgi:hypothetical protein
MSGDDEEMISGGGPSISSSVEKPILAQRDFPFNLPDGGSFLKIWKNLLRGRNFEDPFKRTLPLVVKKRFSLK